MIPRNQHQWTAAVDLLNLIPAQTVSTAEVDGAGVDLIDHHGNAIVTLDASASTTGTVTVKVQSSPAASKVTSKTFTGTGTGRLEIEAGPDPVAENITLTALTDVTTFSVVGSVSGALGTATVGTRFSCAQVKLLIMSGGTAFVAGDHWVCPTTARTWTDVATLAAITTAAKNLKATINLDASIRYLRSIAVPSGTTPSSIVSVNLLAPIQSA